MAKSRRAKAAQEQDAAGTQAAEQHHDGEEARAEFEEAASAVMGRHRDLMARLPDDAGADLPRRSSHSEEDDAPPDADGPEPEGETSPVVVAVTKGPHEPLVILPDARTFGRSRPEAARVRVDDAALDARLAELSAEGWELVQAIQDNRFGETGEVGADGRKMVGHILGWILFVRRSA